MPASNGSWTPWRMGKRKCHRDDTIPTRLVDIGRKVKSGDSYVKIRYFIWIWMMFISAVNLGWRKLSSWNNRGGARFSRFIGRQDKCYLKQNWAYGRLLYIFFAFEYVGVLFFTFSIGLRILSLSILSYGR